MSGMPIVLEPRVHEADGHRPLAYSRSHTFDRSAPNVSCREHPGQAGLQQIRFVSGLLPLAISRGAGSAPGEHEPAVVECELLPEPARMRLRADKDEELARLDPAVRTGLVILDNECF